MAQLPNPKSYEQILGDMLASYMARIGVNDLNVGSAVTGFFEAMAQAVYRASGDTFAILREFSVDRAEGEALQRIAEEERVTPLAARVATGKVTITDTSFTKVSTKIYAGGNPPNVGSTTIQVSNASGFPTSGSLYIGRGTPNIEGPIAYSNVVEVGSFWEITLDTPTTKFHNLSEAVILSQGGTRNIPSGTVVRTLGTGSAPEVNFSTTQSAVILDGETEVVQVNVSAQVPGTEGNVPRNAIRNFVTEPFTGATVTNPNPFTTGRDTETDEDLRVRIKKARISRGLGTANAIKNATLNAQASDENAVITSNEIFSADDTTLFIDNGEGYEELFEGVGLEFIVDSALGGETNFQLQTGGQQTSVVKAFLESTQEAPFEINPNDRLAILVGGILSEHVFNEGDFRSNGAATAFEVVSSINANPNIDFSARTVENGTKITIQAKSETNEFLQKTDPTTGTDAGLAFGLTTSEEETLKLYKNKQLLNRNGRQATVESENQNDWSSTIQGGDTLVVSVDGTQPIVYTFLDSDFLAEGTHTTVSKNNTLQSWVNVINSKITGLTASINGNRIVFVSNLGANSRASLDIDTSSTLVAKGVFTESRGLAATGKESDYVLSRNTAQFKLNDPLEEGDSLTAGTEFTRAEVSTDPILGGNVGFASDAQIWFLVDNDQASIINNGVVADTLFSISKQPANTVRFVSSETNAFANVQPGDYFIIWSEEASSTNRFEGRVHAVGTETNANDYFEFIVTKNEYDSVVLQSNVAFVEGIKFLRSEVAPQKVQIPAGSYNINVAAALIEAGVIGTSASVENEEIINLRTNTYETNGSILVITFNNAAKNLNFTEGQSSTSIFSQVGFQETVNDTAQFPLFVHSSVTSERETDPPNSLIPDFESALDLAAQGIDQNSMICFLHPYLSKNVNINDAQGFGECSQIDALTGTTVDIEDSSILRRLRIGDRFYVASPYDFDYNDSFTVVLDTDASNKTFPINLYRRAITNTTMPANTDEFRAYDVASGTTTEFEQFFGSSFSFKNYKAYMQAKNVIDPSGSVAEDAILYKAFQWGKSGERLNVGYIYPESPDLEIFHQIFIESDIKIRIGLKSGAAVANNIDGTTEFDVTVTPSTPNAGTDEVTYTWNGTGANPQMVTLMAGHFVNIGSTGEFSLENTGVYRISSANSTSFTVRMPAGQATAENGVAVLETNTISLYENSDTTSQEIVDYIAANLADFLIASVLDDGGTSGAGVISLSTHEDGGFATNGEGIQLVDGENFIELSELTNSAPNRQFLFKNSLALASFDTNTSEAYKFSEGQEVRLVPTTAKQLKEFISVLAVSGITTLGVVDNTIRNTRLQIATDTFGNSGAVTVYGGIGNISDALISGVASVATNTEFARVNIARASSNGFHTGQYVKLVAKNVQKKTTGISFTTNVTITPNQPDPDQSIIELGNRDINDRYFGQPRTNVLTRGRAFHVEKHGSLVCISWDGITGLDPAFAKNVEINNGGGNMSVFYNPDSLSTEYSITSGVRSFSEVNIGDTIVIQNFADSANNGTFKVRGVSEDGKTISTSNSQGVNATSAPVNIADIVISTEVSEGDTVDIRSPFSPLNQGKFRVIRRFNNSIYIENDSAIEERVFMSDNLRSLGFTSTTQFDVTVSGDMRIEWNGSGTTPSLFEAKIGDTITVGTAFAAGNRGTFMVTDSGDNFIECANARAVAETGITVSSTAGDVLECQNPGMVISPYETSVAGDRFVISGSVLGSGNRGTYNIVEVQSKDRIVVDAILESVTNQQLNDLSVQVYVDEEKPYTAFKRIHNKTVDPTNNTSVIIIYDNDNQFNKINEAAEITMTAVSKLNYSETVKRGIDAYKYHTGLIAEANRIVYGDPRDSITYPGVSAAGAEIFIEPPLVKKIEVGINVRVRTGVPFTRITEQVRNNIAALINSSPIGQSIAISDIISTVNTIPGTTAVSISSPAYSPSNDVIVVNPSEKPFILDIVNDIAVSKVE